MQAMWSTAATPSGAGGTEDVADCRSIVPMLSGISLGVGSSPMERQCSVASRVNHAYSSQQYQLYNGSCDFQDSYGDPYNSNMRPATTSLRNGCSPNKYDYYNGLFSRHDVSSTPQIPSQLTNYIDIDSLYVPPSTGGVTNDDYSNHVLNRSSSYRDFRMMQQQQQQSATAATGVAAGSGSKENRVCGVCGDKALGYNFDAISCESCKAFFRRNAPKGLEHFKCAYDSNCKMDLSNRRFCKRCRLGKCFEIGMRREYILTDDERAVKRQKIIENRIKRMGSQTASTPTSTASVPTVSEASPGSSLSVSSPGSSQSIPPSTGSPVSVDAQPECGIAPIPNCSGNGAAPPPVAVNFVSAAAVASALDDEDTAAIAELVTAYRESLKVTAPTTDPAPPQEGADPSQSAPQQVKSNSSASNLSDLVNIAEVSIRRVIAMVKQMRSFRAVAHDDQIQLLKGGTIELLILRSVLTFDPNKQQFLDPHDPEDTAAMKVEQLRYAEQGTDLFEDQMAFVKSLVELTLDETTLILLLVIALFSPDRERINDIQLVANEQERYTILLNRYLESTFSVPVARSLFPKLLHKLADLRDLNEKHSMVLLKVNPDGIQPLMKEVLDIDR